MQSIIAKNLRLSSTQIFEIGSSGLSSSDLDVFHYRYLSCIFFFISLQFFLAIIGIIGLQIRFIVKKNSLNCL